MNLKVYVKEKNKYDKDSEQQDLHNNVKETVFYETPKLLRRNGIYYIGYETDEIQIEEWEAIAVYEHPELVFDLIISYRRKFYFNTTEDSLLSLQHFD